MNPYDKRRGNRRFGTKQFFVLWTFVFLLAFIGFFVFGVKLMIRSSSSRSHLKEAVETTKLETNNMKDEENEVYSNT